MTSGDVVLRLAREAEGPNLSAYLRREATRDTDASTFSASGASSSSRSPTPRRSSLPRLAGAAKVALAELQYDEFGAGRPAALHQQLYAEALRVVRPGPRLRCVHKRRLRGFAGVGERDVAVLPQPSAARRRGGALRGVRGIQLGAVPSRSPLGSERGSRRCRAEYFDEHVEADAVHEQIAARDLCGALVAGDPKAMHEVLFGAACTSYLDCCRPPS